MKVDIITPEQQMTLEDVNLVQLPGVDGLFEILNNHAPLISVLGKGRAKIDVKGEIKFYTIQKGVVEVLRNHVKIMTEACTA